MNWRGSRIRASTRFLAALAVLSEANAMIESIGPTAPIDVFYVVQSSGVIGRRDHKVISPLFETRWQADAELARIRDLRQGAVLSVWMRTTHIEPAQWLSDVVMADGTVIHPPA
jgi:hypothetical protein